MCLIVSCEIVSGCVIFVLKNLTQTERSHRFIPSSDFIIGDNCKGAHYLMRTKSEQNPRGVNRTLKDEDI